MVDQDEFELGVDHAPTDSMTPRRSLRPAALPWTVAAVALVVVGVVAAPDGGLPLDGYPPGTVGVLSVDATAPPEELWRTPVEGHGSGYPALTVVGEMVVGLRGDYAVGLSLETGEERWQVPVDTQTCTVREDLSCVERAGEPDAVVLRIDPIRGSEQRIELPFALAAVGFGRDVVVLTQREAELDLQRIDSNGDPRWVSGVDDADLGLESGESLAGYARLGVVGDRAFLTLGVLGTAVDVTTGATTDASSVFLHATAYGYMLRDDDAFSADLLGEGGRVLLENVLMAPDDDPEGPYELGWDGQRLTVTSGEQVVWGSARDRAGPDYPAARVDGVLVVQTMEHELTGRDVRTGDVLWSTTAAAAVLAAAGTTILAVGASDALAGIDVHGGETLWTYGDAAPMALALQPDGLLLLLDDAIVRLAWDRTR